MNCNTTHYRANSSSVPGDPTGTITANVANWQGQILIYQDWASWLVLLLGPPLVGGMVATAGVLVSLHAATVRQAQQTLMVAVMVVVIGTLFSVRSLPASWMLWFSQILTTWSSTQLALAAASVFLAIDLALLLAGMARFQRAKLILD